MNLKGYIARDNSQRRFLAQHRVATLLDIGSNSSNIVPTLQRRVALKIVVLNRPM